MTNYHSTIGFFYCCCCCCYCVKAKRTTSTTGKQSSACQLCHFIFPGFFQRGLLRLFTYLFIYLFIFHPALSAWLPVARTPKKHWSVMPLMTSSWSSLFPSVPAQHWAQGLGARGLFVLERCIRQVVEPSRVRKWGLKPSCQRTPSALGTTKGASVQPHPCPEKHPQVATPSLCPSLTLGLQILTWDSANSWILGFRKKPVIGELTFPVTSKTLLFCCAIWSIFSKKFLPW